MSGKSAISGESVVSGDVFASWVVRLTVGYMCHPFSFSRKVGNCWQMTKDLLRVKIPFNVTILINLVYVASVSALLS